MRCLHPFTLCLLKVRNLLESAQRAERGQIDHPITLGRLLDLVIPAVHPLPGMAYNAGTHHVQVDVHETAMKMGTGFDGGGVMTIFPAGALIVDSLRRLVVDVILSRRVNPGQAGDEYRDE